VNADFMITVCLSDGLQAAGNELIGAPAPLPDNALGSDKRTQVRAKIVGHIRTKVNP
jgi:hypothetical protein